MKYIFSILDKYEFDKYNNFKNENQKQIENYLDYIKKNFNVKEYPDYIVLCNYKIATTILSDIPIPAYTNERRIVFTPEIKEWQKIYKMQLEDYDKTKQVENIFSYYDNMSSNYLLQVIGHELTHHSELFLDDFEDELDSGIWFEEGMCEYISKKFFLTEKEFRLEKEISEQIFKLFEENYPWKSLEDFGSEDYEDEGYTSLFYNYTRSFLAIDKIIKELGSIEKIFEEYKKWDLDGRKVPLVKWFKIE